MNDLRLFDPLALEPLDDAWRSMLRPWKLDMSEVAPRIKLDVTEQDTSYTVKADIPGVRKDDIDIRIDGSQVTLSAELRKQSETKENGRVLRSERQMGYASRSFTLASAVDEAKAEAHYENGVLELLLPKKASAASKRLTVR
jgi:HSP20 family protein